MIRRLLFTLLASVFFYACSEANSQEAHVAMPKASQTAPSANEARLPAATLQAVFQEMLGTAVNWNRLGQGDKAEIIARIINLFQVRDNTAILNSPEFYVSKIDDAMASNPSLGQMPLPNLVKIMAVMEYDFYNGQNKDDLAREVLGEQMFEAIQAQRNAGPSV